MWRSSAYKSFQLLRCMNERHITGIATKRDDSILAEGEAEFGVAGDLKNELAVSPLVQQLVGRQPADRQPTEHERARREAEILIAGVAPQAHEFNALDFPAHLFRDPDVLLDLFDGAIGRCDITGAAKTERGQFGHTGGEGEASRRDTPAHLSERTSGSMRRDAVPALPARCN
jgi:hypothetical protein